MIKLIVPALLTVLIITPAHAQQYCYFNPAGSEVCSSPEPSQQELNDLQAQQQLQEQQDYNQRQMQSDINQLLMNQQ